MSTSKIVILYLITTAVFLAVDFVWLSTATSRLYEPHIGDILSDSPRLGVAGVFYLFYVVGLLALAVVPALQDGSVWEAVWRGALFGAVAYGTYDLTNLATIDGWAWQVTAIDIVWGTVLNTVVATVSYLAGSWLGLVR